ncbi:unnamed protein product [Prunus armeniaca]
MVVHEGERGEPLVDSWEAEYKEMQWNYSVLEAVADRVLALPHTPEVGSSNQASPSGPVGVAVASASEGVDILVGVPLSRRNILTEVKLAELRTNFSVPPSVGLRLPSAADVMMLAKLGCPPGQYNPNSWILLHGGSFGWVQANCLLLISLGGTCGVWLMRTRSVSQGGPAGSMKWRPISKEQEDKVERVRSLLSKTEHECKNLVTQKNLLESGLLYGMAGIIKGSTKVVVDLDDAEMQRRLRESPVQKAEKEVPGRRWRALEEAHQSVMGTGPRLPPFDLQAPPKLPFGVEDVYAKGVEKVDFSRLRREKKEVNLAMHHQEVPLVNVFLEGMKSDLEVLVRTPASSYADQAQKTFLTHAYKAALAREVEELKRSRADEVAAARAEVEQKKAEEIATARAELLWEERSARFNPSVEINFDTSGEPPSLSPTTEATPEPELELATTDAPSTES